MISVPPPPPPTPGCDVAVCSCILPSLLPREVCFPHSVKPLRSLGLDLASGLEMVSQRWRWCSQGSLTASLFSLLNCPLWCHTQLLDSTDCWLVTAPLDVLGQSISLQSNQIIAGPLCRAVFEAGTCGLFWHLTLLAVFFVLSSWQSSWSMV